MENEFYLQQPNPTWNSTTCDLNPYFANTSNNSDWNSSFHSTLTSVQMQQQAPLISADPGFVERAARFSMFGSCQELKFHGSEFEEIPDGKQMNGFSPENGEESSVSESVKSTPLNSRKRKSNPKGKNEFKIKDADTKRTKSDVSNGTEKRGRNGNGKASRNSNNDEPFRDYIHVRARRGQATDSHSLAERVRREKISQRMKFLQDLVPGCNKVTGKAVMLDEIINYVQSLQRQVEFLSMKLSTLNQRTDINLEALLSKDLHQAQSLLSKSIFALESSPGSLAFPCGYPPQGPFLKKNAHSDESESSFSMNLLNTQRPNHVVQLPPSVDGFDQSASQVSMWMDELHNVFQMGYGQDELQNFQASLTTDMKMEQ